MRQQLINVICGFLLVMSLFACTQNENGQLVPDYKNKSGEIRLPGSNDLWKNSDYLTFAVTYMKTFENLPSSKSRKTAKLFNNMIDPNNFSYLADQSISLDERIKSSLDLIASVKPITIIYKRAHRYKVGTQEDLVLVTGFLLEATSLQVVMMMEEFKPSLDPTDNSYVTRIAGVNQMITGIEQELDGSILIINDSQSYDESVREQFTRNFSKSYLRMAKYLPVDKQQKFVKKLTALQERELNQEILSELKKIIS